MEKDLIDIVELMDCPRLHEWEEIYRLFKYDKRILYLLANVFNYGKMIGKQEVRLKEEKILKRITRKYGEKYREPKMTVDELIDYLGMRDIVNTN